MTDVNLGSPAEALVGLWLDGDWEVVERLPSLPSRTASTFSIGYVVRDRSGRTAFCKALDYSTAWDAEDPAEELQRLSAAYLFERDLLDRCKNLNMSRVVRALASGAVRVDGFRPPTVNYLVFERADGDARDLVLSGSDMPVSNYAALFDFVKDCGVALGQMHRAGMSHQDIKPSNSLFWTSGSRWTGKLADLGRSFCASLENPDTSLGDCPGDTQWAPPELLYGMDVSVRSLQDRQLADLYSLGSLLVYCLTDGLPFGALTSIQLAPEHRWSNWEGGYRSAQSYLEDAHETSLERLRTMLPAAITDDVHRLVHDMCHPLVEERGRLAKGGLRQASYLLERYVSKLDLISKTTSVSANRLMSKS